MWPRSRASSGVSDIRSRRPVSGRALSRPVCPVVRCRRSLPAQPRMRRSSQVFTSGRHRRVWWPVRLQRIFVRRISLRVRLFQPSSLRYYRVMYYRGLCYCRMSVCPSVTRCISSKWLSISSNFFTFGYTHNSSFSTSNVMAIFRRGPSNGGGGECTGYEKIAISSNISLYLGSDIRHGYSYYRMRLYSSFRIIPWVTLSDLAKYWITQSIARSLRDSWASYTLQWSV